MLRSDLMALTADDLATLTNRGTVKRAQKELEAGEVTCEIRDEPGGGLVFAWSDGITCRFPPGQAVHEAVCSSGAAGITRHIVRSVLAYQRAGLDRQTTSEPADAGSARQDGNRLQEDLPDAETASCFVAGEIWDPGQISDDDLLARFRSAAVTKARKRFEQEPGGRLRPARSALRERRLCRVTIAAVGALGGLGVPRIAHRSAGRTAVPAARGSARPHRRARRFGRAAGRILP